MSIKNAKMKSPMPVYCPICGNPSVPSTSSRLSSGTSIFQCFLNLFQANWKGKTFSFCELCRSHLILISDLQKKLQVLQNKIKSHEKELQTKFTSSEVKFERNKLYEKDGRFIRFRKFIRVSLPEPDSDSIISDNDDDDYEQVLEEAQPEKPFKVEFIKVEMDDDPLSNSTTHDDDDDRELDEEREHSTDSETIEEDNSSSSASEEEDDEFNEEDDDEEYKPSTSDLEKPARAQKRPRDFTKFLKSADGNEISFHNVTLCKIPSSNEDPDRYRCTECDTILPDNRDILRFHIIRAHTTLYACPHCPKRFEKTSKVERHVTEVHQKLPNSTQIKTFQCDICEDEFPGIKSLQHHIKRAHSNDKSLCGVCGKEVKNLRIHIKSKHTAPEDMKFECPTCKMKFSYGGQFRQHLKQAHLSEKPHKCKVCGKGFKLPRYLKEHLPVHENVKPFSCHVCGIGFSRVHPMRRHITKFHENQKLEDITN